MRWQLLLLGVVGCAGCGSGAADAPDAAAPDGAPPDAAPADAAIDVDPGPARLVLSPTTHDYGIVAAGDSAQATLTVMNPGGAATSAPSVALAGLHAADFSVPGGECAAALAPGASCTVTVRFTAGALGVRGATLTVSALTGGAASADLRAEVVPAALLRSPTAPVAFGSIATGTPSVPRTVVFENGGGVASGPLAITIAGAQAADFAVATDGCTGMRLAPAQQCTVTVRMTATATGARAGSLEARATPGGSAAVALGGTGLTPAALQLMPTSIGFGTTYVGSQSSLQCVTLRNNGQATAFLQVALSGTDAAEFRSSNSCGGSVLGGSSCNVCATFQPTSRGSKSATLTVSAPGTSASATLTGSARVEATIVGTPKQLGFGTITVGQSSAAQVWTLTNIGDDPSIIVRARASGDAADFVLTDSCPQSPTQLAAGASCTMSWLFRPTAIGPRTYIYGVRAVPQDPEDYLTLTGTGR